MQCTLPQQHRQIPVKATFTARNMMRKYGDFVSQFVLDPTKCSEKKGDPAVNQTIKEGGNKKAFQIIEVQILRLKAPQGILSKKL